MKYLIIGNGKVANNFANYLSLLKIPFEKWDRNTDVSLEKSVQDCNTALILIKDSEIDGFIEDNPPLKDKKLVHFSASLDSNFAQSIHPLASFTENLKTLEEYKKYIKEMYKIIVVLVVTQIIFYCMKPDKNFLDQVISGGLINDELLILIIVILIALSTYHFILEPLLIIN